MIEDTAGAVDAPAVEAAAVVELPSADYMRGYVAGYPHGDVIDQTMRDWLGLLIEAYDAQQRRLQRYETIVDRLSYELTEQETKVYRYLRNTSLSYEEIAAHSHHSVNTIKTQGKAVFRKTGVTRRRQLKELPDLPNL